MTTHQPQPPTSAADLDAARLLLSRLGVSPADLLAAPQDRDPVPTFAEYIPIVSEAVTDGPSTRRAVPDARLAEINHVAATTGNDPALDTLLLRLHTETACRRGGALALRPDDLDPDQCLIRLREKGGNCPLATGLAYLDGSPSAPCPASSCAKKRSASALYRT